MKKFDLEILEKNNQKNILFLTLGVIFFLGSILITYFGYKEQTREIRDMVNMSMLLEPDIQEGDYAYIDVNQVPYLFAAYKTDGVEEDEKFYLIMDKNNFLYYIVYMDYSEYLKLNKDDIKENPIKLIGYLKKIDSNIKEKAISSYNKELGETYLTNDNFEQYVGTYLLDTVTPLTNPFPYYIIAAFIFLFALIFFIDYFLNHNRTKKSIQKYSQEEIHKIEAEVYALTNNPYSKMKLYLTKNYLVDSAKGIVILEYKDILWAYPYEYRYNGLIVNKCIKVVTRNNKHYDICNTKYLKNKKEETIEEVLDFLEKKNPEIIIGFTKENKNQVKEIIKNKQINKKTI